ncbi:MAG: hypothetical protein OEY23_17740 [Acidimicrobiia bacterium]|nr:hypothetical protein [Acidimicrobiia bacterium]MDH4353500.1 hypothetical protein [Actinomycetota bacterium]
MTAPIVRLHIGAMKTGTTYVQQMLAANAVMLKESGVLYPMPWPSQVAATRDALGLKGGDFKGPVTGSWDAMLERIHSWDGPEVVMSMEFLSFADPEGAKKVVTDLAPCQVEVVLGARDLARTVPAQWATAVRNGQQWTYRKYLDQLTRRAPSSAQRHFWLRQDLGAIASNWAAQVGPEHTHVVTVPPRGADPALLWNRMAGVLNLDAAAMTDSTPKNESLGPTTIELLRRVNVAAAEADMPKLTYKTQVNRELSHVVLPAIPEQHPSLVVPDEFHDWVRQQSDRILAEIRASGAAIVGDLADLEPVMEKGRPMVWPEDLPTEDLLESAVAALVGYASLTAERELPDSRRAAAGHHPIGKRGAGKRGGKGGGRRAGGGKGRGHGGRRADGGDEPAE